MREATIITDEPIIEVIAEMKLNDDGILAMAEWVKRYRPDCVPNGVAHVGDLLPHSMWEPFPYERIDPESGEQKYRRPSDNELLCELAGRKCYDSFAEKGAKRTNAEYLASMWTGRGVPHRSTGYHAKMSFFFAHISRRVSHELIRNYVGSDRDEEGSPSQESTRYTEHPGVYICHPRDLPVSDKPSDLGEREMAKFNGYVRQARQNYADYLAYIAQEGAAFRFLQGSEPKGMDRKRIFEAASGRLLMSCATSFIWTTNPMALTKFFHERCDEASDLEMQRFAKKLRRVCVERWPNLFPGLNPL